MYMLPLLPLLPFIPFHDSHCCARDRPTQGGRYPEPCVSLACTLQDLARDWPTEGGQCPGLPVSLCACMQQYRGSLRDYMRPMRMTSDAWPSLAQVSIAGKRHMQCAILRYMVAEPG